MMLYPLYTLSSCLITSLNSHWNLDWIEQRRFCFNFSCLFVKGTYVLQDNNFQLLTQMSDGKQYTEEARKVCRYFTRLKFLIYLPVVWLENRSGKKNAKDKLQRLQISLTSKFLECWTWKKTAISSCWKEYKRILQAYFVWDNIIGTCAWKLFSQCWVA